MANDIAVTPGSGATAATDDRNSVHFPVAMPYARQADLVNGTASNTDGSSFSVIAAQGASIKTAIVSVAIANTSTSTVVCDIKDGTTTKATLPVPPGGCIYNPGLPIVGTANTAWNCDPSAATTTIYCTIVGYKTY